MKKQTKTLWISVVIYFVIICGWYLTIPELTTAGAFVYALAELLYIGFFFTILLFVNYFTKMIFIKKSRVNNEIFDGLGMAKISAFDGTKIILVENRDPYDWGTIELTADELKKITYKKAFYFNNNFIIF